MCCFSRAVSHVSGTSIFARGRDDGSQILVYSMSVAIDDELAMVLPLPVAQPAREDAVRFVDLRDYDDYFHALSAAFPPIFQPASRGGFGPPASVPKLVVHDVGDFEASFVPSPSDFGRLDERFRLPSELWERIPLYADWGFAVFKLKPKKGILGIGRKTQTPHPMALTFPRRDARALFFPTVHVHDGHVKDTAPFDHTLYCQASPVVERLFDWARSSSVLGQSLDAARAGGTIDPARHGYRTLLHGELPNRDVWLRDPPGVSLDRLEMRGECFDAAVSGKSAFWHGLSGDPHASWAEAAERALPALCAGLGAALTAWTAARRATWKLAPLHDGLAPHWKNGGALFRGDDVFGGPGVAGGPGRVRFAPFSKHVEPQRVTLGFAEIPDADALGAIDRELSALVERVATTG